MTPDLSFPVSLMVGDKVFVYTKFNILSPKTWLSALVRVFGHLRRNHCKVVGKKDGILKFVEAVEGGVEFNPIIYNPKKERILVRRNIIPVDEELYNARLLSIEGKGYDYENLLWDQLLWNNFHIWIGAKTEEEAEKKFICYEVGFFVDKDNLDYPWWECHPDVYLNAFWMDTIYEE